ncbi:hypothetical protein BN873_300051 [Candidatus Competibacter denitrificans Run_A_D11]|uniref:Uncharacterized protein n=1 Tax=Candidatus Competibacter denitrificans Run_A_D11 TaxID=1400863 RepID=W6M9J0_9GAMM|nr:hypothetical protein BN873_300051 [Candidatus Competibacter denitrificans Run_A_D11]
MLVAWLTQSGAKINQARAHDPPPGIDHAVGHKPFGRAANTDNLPFGDKNITERIDPVGRINQSAAANRGAH